MNGHSVQYSTSRAVLNLSGCIITSSGWLSVHILYFMFTFSVSYHFIAFICFLSSLRSSFISVFLVVLRCYALNYVHEAKVLIKVVSHLVLLSPKPVEKGSMLFALCYHMPWPPVLMVLDQQQHPPSRAPLQLQQQQKLARNYVAFYG